LQIKHNNNENFEVSSFNMAGRTQKQWEKVTEGVDKNGKVKGGGNGETRFYEVYFQLARVQ